MLTLMSYEDTRPFSCPVMIVSSRNHSIDVILECFIGRLNVGLELFNEESIMRLSMTKSSES